MIYPKNYQRWVDAFRRLDFLRVEHPVVRGRKGGPALAATGEQTKEVLDLVNAALG